MKKWICLLVASAAIFYAPAQAQTPPKLGAGEVFGNPTGSSALGRSVTPAAMDIVTTRFGGKPWFDVKSAANSCAAAVGDGVADDTTAIQCHVTYMHATYGGGGVFFPPGTYTVSGGGFNVPAGVWLIGSGVQSTRIQSLTNAGVMSFSISAGTCPSGNHDGGMEKIFVTGFASVTATAATVLIGAGCNVTIRDSKIHYGGYGLWNDGVDGLIENCFIWGYVNAIISHGANWYIRVKADQPGADPSTYGFNQLTPIAALTTAENHFLQSDFTGTYTASVHISDSTGTNAVTTFEGSVFSAPIQIVLAKATIFTGAEFGSTTLTTSSGFVNIVGSYAFSATTATGAATRSCAGNAQITC